MNTQANIPTVDALGVRVDALDMPTALGRVHALLNERRAAYVCVTGVHGVMEAQRDTCLLRAYADADMVVPDGMPLVWLGRMQGQVSIERVTGPDLMLEVFRDPDLRQVRHFLYGGEEGVAELLKEKLLERCPWAQIVGTWTPPFRELNQEEEERLLCQVRSTQPDVLWVGISCPRQELFMAAHRLQLNVPIMFGVGAAFDFHTGRIRDCSDWIKRAGLQWVHRLLQDPRRLWKRYLRNNPAFVWQVGRQMLGLRKAQIRHTPELSRRNPVQSGATKL